MRYITTILLWLIIISGELHTQFSGRMVKYCLACTDKIPLNWQVKYLTHEAWFIMMAAAVFLYKPNRVNRTTAVVYFLFCVADLVLYIVNFKRDGYGWIYASVLPAWLLIYYYGNRTTDRQGVVTSGKF